MTAKRLQQSKGFTLLETMIAITILLIAVVGPISVIGDSLHKIYFARDQMIAINLAQEGIEAVRQVRDTNFLNGAADWSTGFGNGECTGGLLCVIDTNPSVLIHKCNSGCTTANGKLLVYKDPADNLYHQYLTVPGGVTPTIFSRKVDTYRISGGDEYRVEVTVTWTTGNIPGSVVASETIFKWAQP